MIPIHPISEAVCKAFYGKPVCVILEDGAQLVGTLSQWEKGKLILNDDSAVKLKTQTQTQKSRTRKGKPGTKAKKALEAKTAAFPVAPSPIHPFGGSRMEFEPSRIAMLFALI